MKKVRPPYQSDIPVWPSDDQVKHLCVDDDPNFKGRKGYEHNLIWESIKGGLADFWNKLASPTIDNFYPISYAEEKAYKKSLRLFKGEMKKVAKINSEYKARSILGLNHKNTLADLFDILNKSIEQMMTEEQIKAINDIIIPYYLKELPLRNRIYNRFPSVGVRNWLVMRAYELGFNVEIHGEYDSWAKRFTFDHSHDRLDRIGKKYQWIAFYELLGILSDNYKFVNDYANGGAGRYESFNGTWQSFLRNINPSMIARDMALSPELFEYELDSEPKTWYNDEEYNNWNYSAADDSWISLMEDLPDPVYMIQKFDDDGVEWLTLNNCVSWDEPKELGKEKYHYDLVRHSVALFVDAILVKKVDLEQAVLDLRGKNLYGTFNVPSDDWQYLVNREKFWSPAYKDVYRSRIEWQAPSDLITVPFIYSSEMACGNIDGDKSGTISKYSIPCKTLFEGLKMEYDSHDGQYIDKDGNLVAITYGYDQILVKKDSLLKFLEESELTILWVVRGEKRIYMRGGMGCLSENNPCGVYHLNSNNNPEGFLCMYKRV